MPRYEKCDQCVGQHNKSRLTKQLYDDGTAYCHRCGYVWRNTNVVDLLSSLQDEFELDDDDITPLYNWRTVRRTPVEHERTTVLNTYSSVRTNHVAFRMTKANGDIVGYHNRSTVSKTFFNEGDRGISFVGEEMYSSPSRPLIVVEGPYDVITDQHVCVYGTLSKSNIAKHFRLKWCWLHPDPDCVDTAEKRKRFEKMIRELVLNEMVLILGYIISDADPDDATVLHHVGIQEFS